MQHIRMCSVYSPEFRDFLSDLDEDPGGGDFNVETESGGSHKLHVHSVPVHIDKLHSALHGLGRERERERGRIRSEVAVREKATHRDLLFTVSALSLSKD